MIWTAVTSLLSVVGGGVASFFGVKEKQVENMGKAIEAIEKTNSSAAAKEKAIATVVQSEARSGYWLASVWRPLLMVILGGLVVAYSFGFTTPNLMTEMPEHSMISQLFELLKIGVMGYLPLRTVEKIVDKMNLASIMNKITENYVNKK